MNYFFRTDYKTFVVVVSYDDPHFAAIARVSKTDHFDLLTGIRVAVLRSGLGKNHVPASLNRMPADGIVDVNFRTLLHTIRKYDEKLHRPLPEPNGVGKLPTSHVISGEIRLKMAARIFVDQIRFFGQP